MIFSKLTKTILAASSLFFTYSASCNSINDSKSKFLSKIVKTKQYRANDPIEDRICVAEVDKVKAILVAVFDGHGGELCVYLSINLG